MDLSILIVAVMATGGAIFIGMEPFRRSKQRSVWAHLFARLLPVVLGVSGALFFAAATASPDVRPTLAGWGDNCLAIAFWAVALAYATANEKGTVETLLLFGFLHDRNVVRFRGEKAKPKRYRLAR